MLLLIHSNVAAFISSLLVCVLVFAVNKRKNLQTTRIALFVLFVTIVSHCIQESAPPYIVPVLFVSAVIVLCKYLLRQKTATSVVMALVVGFLQRIGVLLYYSVAFLAGGNFESDINGLISMIYAMVFINLTSAAVVYLYWRYQRHERIVSKTPKQIEWFDFLALPPIPFGIAYFLIGLLDTVLGIMICYNGFRVGNMGVYIGCLFVIFMYSLLMILTLMMVQSLLKNQIELTMRSGELENLTNYTSIIENLLNDLQRSRHDYKNILISIKDYINEKDYDSLERYFNEEILKNENKLKITENIFTSLSHIKNLGVKGLINAKLSEAMRNGIRVEISIFNDIDIQSVKTIDACRIMGIFLDNAIEAANVAEDKVLSISMLKENGSCNITICNSFAGEIDRSRLFSKGYSTKGKSRGLGLHIVKNLIEKDYNNILLNTSVESNFLIQDITIIEAGTKTKEDLKNINEKGVLQDEKEDFKHNARNNHVACNHGGDGQRREC